MSDIMSVASLPEPAAAEFTRLLNESRAEGHLSLDVLVHALPTVEFDPELIEDIRQACEKAGVVLDEDLDSPVPEEIVVPKRPDGAEPEASADGMDDERAARAAAFAATIGDDVDEAKPRRRRSPPRSREDAGSDDPVRMYLKEIGRFELLDARQEIRVAARIKRGLEAEAALLVLADAGETAVLSPADQSRYQRLVRDGSRASDELTRANLRLVVSIAKRYVGRGMSLLDLIQEGNLGLMRAVEKFDHTKGFKFSTYATWWIRQAITRAIADQARTIRIPVHMVEAMNRVRRIQRQMHQELKREPTIEELAAEVGESETKVRDMLRIGLDPLSLDSPVGDEDESNLSDFIEDRNAAAPVEIAARHMLSDAVSQVLDQLDYREQEVVRLRFGLVDGRPRTLEEVGREFGVTRERIRQIESKTLAKLRHPLRSEGLRDYLEGA